MADWTATILLIFQISHAAIAQDVASAPQCAQSCLAKATTAQDTCTGLDVKCLCTNNDFMSELYCCLATTCSAADQQKGIDFNIASCNAVNESAPNFVGCAPLADADEEPQTSTISGPIESALTSFVYDEPTTADFDGKALLTGTCTDVHYAQVTTSTDDITQFAEIGCSDRLAGCCPFDPSQNAVLNECPKDYTTTAGACCPSDWEIYSTEIGGQTPCFTKPAVAYVPAQEPTSSDITLIRDRLFARKFDLSESALGESSGLSSGAIAGIVIGVLTLVGLVGAAALLFVLRRRRQRTAQAAGADSILSKPSASPSRHSTKGGGGVREMAVAVSNPQSDTHELASPQIVPSSPGSPTSLWLAASTKGGDDSDHGGTGVNTTTDSFSAYERNQQNAPERQQVKQVNQPKPAQELPGSTFIYEHHPAYSPSPNHIAGRSGDSGSTRRRSLDRTHEIFTTDAIPEGSSDDKNDAVSTVTTPTRSNGTGISPRQPPVSPSASSTKNSNHYYNNDDASNTPSSPPRTPTRNFINRAATVSSLATPPSPSSHSLPASTATTIATAGENTHAEAGNVSGMLGAPDPGVANQSPRSKISSSASVSSGKSGGGGGGGGGVSPMTTTPRRF